MRRVKAIVTGHVQGVSYRASTAAEARRLGIVGWVKNRPDGCVELEAQGSPEQVATLVQWCEYGPPGATVGRVTVEELAAKPGEKTFEIV
jgi:acylphosphatase